MSGPTQDGTIIRCSCGKVEVELIGAPIACAACYCRDCDAGARRIEALPNAGPVRDADGATSYVLYRKDRVRCSNGAQLLRGSKLNEKSITNRVIATCCNSAMFVNFDRGPHWFRCIETGLKDMPRRCKCGSTPSSVSRTIRFRMTCQATRLFR